MTSDGPVVDRAPQPHALATDVHEQHINVPATRRLLPRTTDVPGGGSSEFHRPKADHLGREMIAFERDQLQGSLVGWRRAPPVAQTGTCLPDNAFLGRAGGGTI